MAQGEYKKSYDGDYSKSYKNFAVWKKQTEIRRQEYEVVSRKLNETTYSKSERQSIYNAGSRPKESERVNSDGSTSRRTRTSYKEPVKRNWVEPKSRYEELKEEHATEASAAEVKPLDKVKKTYQPPTSMPASPKATPVIKPIIEKPKEVKPQYQTTKEEPKRWKNAYDETPEAVEVEVEDDGNYNHYDYPIEEIGQEKFMNLKTNTTIGSDEARTVLKTAGYIPQSGFGNVGSILFAFIIANIILPLAAPIVAIGYGAFKISVTRTTWLKGVGNNKTKYSMPATSAEKVANRMVGQICIVIGFIAAFIHYSKFF